MLNFGGIAGASYGTGRHSCDFARDDLEKEEHTMRQNNLHFGEYLGIWFDTHELIEEYGDLLENAADRLYLDRVLGSEFWEEEILLSH